MTASRTLRGTCVSGGADLKSAKRNQPGTRSCQDGDFKRRRKGALHDHCQCGFRSESGDTILIDAGTYKAQDILLTKNLTIEAAGNGPVVLQEIPSASEGHADCGFV